MGNTVGSQRNLNLRQRNILIGTLLGDGVLEINGRNVRLRVDHSEKQREYVEWKHNEFLNIASRRIRFISQKCDPRTGEEYKHYRFDTFSLSSLMPFYNLFYKNGRRQIPENISQLLKSPLSLAVWFMDDGYKRNDCNALRLSTDCFNLGQQKLLIDCLRERFEVSCRIHKKGKYWNIYIPSSQSKKFCRIVGPHIIPSMRYKISLTP